MVTSKFTALTVQEAPHRWRSSVPAGPYARRAGGPHASEGAWKLSKRPSDWHIRLWPIRSRLFDVIWTHFLKLTGHKRFCDTRSQQNDRRWSSGKKRTHRLWGEKVPESVGCKGQKKHPRIPKIWDLSAGWWLTLPIISLKHVSWQIASKNPTKTTYKLKLIFKPKRSCQPNSFPKVLQQAIHKQSENHPKMSPNISQQTSPTFLHQIINKSPKSRLFSEVSKQKENPKILKKKKKKTFETKLLKKTWKISQAVSLLPPLAHRRMPPLRRQQQRGAHRALGAVVQVQTRQRQGALLEVFGKVLEMLFGWFFVWRWWWLVGWSLIFWDDCLV